MAKANRLSQKKVTLKKKKKTLMTLTKHSMKQCCNKFKQKSPECNKYKLRPRHFSLQYRKKGRRYRERKCRNSLQAADQKWMEKTRRTHNLERKLKAFRTKADAPSKTQKHRIGSCVNQPKRREKPDPLQLTQVPKTQQIQRHKGKNEKHLPRRLL